MINDLLGADASVDVDHLACDVTGEVRIQEDSRIAYVKRLRQGRSRKNTLRWKFVLQSFRYRLNIEPLGIGRYRLQTKHWSVS